MKLDDQLLLRIAEWKPAVDGWPDDGGDDLSLARYDAFIEGIQALPLRLQRGDGHDYGDTFFRFFLYDSESSESFEGDGIYVALSRFAPIGIYGQERRAWGINQKSRASPKTTGYGGFPSIDNVYNVPDPSLTKFAQDVRATLTDNDIYVPRHDELALPITFDLPKLFLDNANVGSTMVFHVLFNDLY